MTTAQHLTPQQRKTMADKHLIPQTQEAHYRNGIGVTVAHSEFLAQTVIIVNDEEMAANPLVRAWVEALANAEKTATREAALQEAGLI
jgi:hypothetical protein